MGQARDWKNLFYKQHTQRLSWRTAAAPPHAVVLQRYRVLKNVVRQGKRRVENCGQILFPAAGPAHPRLCCLCCELEVEKSAVKEDFWIEGVVGGGREPFLKLIWYIFVTLSAIIQWIFERVWMIAHQFLLPTYLVFQIFSIYRNSILLTNKLLPFYKVHITYGIQKAAGPRSSSKVVTKLYTIWHS